MTSVVSVNSLSIEDKKKLKNAVLELNDSMLRVEAERQLQKDISEKVCGEIGVDKPLVREMAKTYFMSNFNDKSERYQTFEEFYSVVINSAI